MNPHFISCYDLLQHFINPFIKHLQNFKAFVLLYCLVSTFWAHIEHTVGDIANDHEQLNEEYLEKLFENLISNRQRSPDDHRDFFHRCAEPNCQSVY